MTLAVNLTSKPAERPVMTRPDLAPAIITAFFDALGQRDVTAVTALWHPDGMVVGGFNASGDTGLAAVRAVPNALHLAAILKHYDEIAFGDIVTSVADDGGTVWVETRGALRVAATGAPYCNRYVFKFTVDDGRISRLVEYANTVTQSRHGHAATATPGS
jgi:ketosteroid isomerase-like protein